MPQRWWSRFSPQYSQRYTFIILSILCVFSYYAYSVTNLKYFAPAGTRIVLSTGSTEHTTNDSIKIKYILQWTTGKVSPLYHMGTGRSKLIKMGCPYDNCYFTDNKAYLTNIQDFDAIVFNGNDVIKMNEHQLPQERSPTQKYVFGGTESAPNRMGCNRILDNFFNWTWTYRLDSDIRWSYILISNMDGDEVGPNKTMDWPDMEPIEDEETIKILDGKSKAAAWFVTHCKTLGGREAFVKKLKPEMAKFNLTLDVYGKCGELQCPRTQAYECYDMVKTDYYFYLSFENSFASDYVTEKLLTALNNYAVPIVFGGADYSRFLPPGSYLNARTLGPQKLAVTMKEIIDNKTRYHDFFRWRNHFQYKRGENDTEVCNICTALNDENKVNRIDIRGEFRKWWHEGYQKKCKD